MKDVIEEIRNKLDRLDEEQSEIEEKLEYKRFQLKKVNSLISKLEKMQDRQAEG